MSNLEPSSVVVTATNDADVRREINRLTRRSFVTGGLAALTGLGGWQWLRTRPDEAGISWPLRRVLQFNERLSRAISHPHRVAPSFARSATAEPRVNGRYGVTDDFDVEQWGLNILSPGAKPIIERTLPINAIRELPRVEMVTELKCVEGWSQVVHWAGARLSDFAAKYGHEAGYVSLATPDNAYYVGLERESLLHAQTLLCYEMNEAPLTLNHGAPLRLVCPLKYGVKHIKRIGSIQFTDQRPADFWAERGYDWYLGH